MRVTRVAATTALAVSATMAIASPAWAGDTECRGSLGAVTVVGNVIVPDDATCDLTGTTVQGAVVVKSRTTLNATGATATGGVQGESPSTVNISDSTFGNGITISKAELNNGHITIRTSDITGDIQVADNRNPVTLDGNDVTGSVQANKNVGGLTIINNRIDNGLQCQDNTPPPTGGGNIAVQKQGQCQGL